MLTIGMVTSVSIQSYNIIDSIPVLFVPVTYLFRSQNSLPLNPFSYFPIPPPLPVWQPLVPCIYEPISGFCFFVVVLFTCYFVF